MMIIMAAAAAVSYCSYIGDSIAVGLESVDKTCSVYAKVGAGSDFITKHYVGKDRGDYTVVSMGSNDPKNPRLYQNAVKLRKSFKQAELVVWILPRDRRAAEVIRKVANQFQDNWVDLGKYPSNDNIHPKSYKQINKDIIDGVMYYYN